MNSAQRISTISKLYSKKQNELNQLIKSNNDAKIQCVIGIFLIEECGFRVGNKKSSTENGHFGTTTLQNKHVNKRKKEISFIGKSGVVNKCALNGLKKAQQLLEYVTSSKKSRTTDILQRATEKKINNILSPLTSQDIRRLRANTIFLDNLKGVLADERKERQQKVKSAVEKAAASIQNKPATCRRSYLAPEIITLYLDYPKKFQRILNKYTTFSAIMASAHRHMLRTKHR